MKCMTQAIQRIMQALAAALLIVLLLPLLLVIALLVRLTSQGPALFVSKRIGLGERPFRIWKFRTMRVNSEQELERLAQETPDTLRHWQTFSKLPNDPRVTTFGRFLRKTSLDELPQLWNVLRGDMNFIGPRPIIEAERARYGASFARVISVKPGITGLWQVSGRNDISFEKRIELDLDYVEHQSVFLDTVILFKTIREILSAHGK